MNKAKPWLIVLVLLVLAGAIYFVHLQFFARPHYIFVNQTGDHDHDLALKMSLKIAEQRAGIENALVMLDRLPANMTVQETAHRIFQKLRVGERRGGKGILYLYSREENLFKIEVSYALEAVIPDATCSVLEEAARSYMLSDVPEDFLVELMVTLNIHSKEMGAESERAWGAPEWAKDFFLSGGAGVRSQVFDRSVSDYRDAIRRLPTEAVSRYQPLPEPEHVIEQYLSSLEAGLGEPQLPLLTEGSRIFRMIVPRSSAQQHRILQYYRKAMPYRLFVRGSLALAVFRPGTPNLPILLRKLSDGLWYVDEPKAWTWFDRYENGDDFFVKSSDMPFMPDLLEMRHPGALGCKFGERVSTPPPMGPEQSLAAYISEREAAVKRDPNSAEAHARLGDAYFFELGFVTKALSAYEAASRLDPGNVRYRWRLVDIYVYARENEKFLNQLWELAYGMRLRQFLSFSPVAPGDKLAIAWYHWYSSFMKQKPGEFRALRPDELL